MLLPVLMLALAALACNLPGGQKATVQPTAAGLELPTVEPSATQAKSTATQAAKPPTAASVTKTQPANTQSATKAATKPALLEFNFKGVKFSYPQRLFSGATGQVAPVELNDPSSSGWPGSIPERIQIDINGYPLPKTFHKPQIMLYPIKEYADANSAAGDIFNSLNAALSGSRLEPQRAPFLPMWNAGQVFNAKNSFFGFQNGQGVRYLSCHAQAIVPVDNVCLFYTYQGKTVDGNYYLSVVLPVKLPALDQQEYKSKFDPANMDGPKYESYLKEMLSVLEKAKPTDFTPSLDDLDALVRSLSAAPTVGLKGVEKPSFSCPGALATRLKVEMRVRVTFTDGTPLRLREAPGKDAKVLTTIPEGGAMMVTGGPQCVSSGVWWNVKLDSGGKTGWVLEGEDNVYYIEPLP